MEDIDVTWQPRTVDWNVHVWTIHCLVSGGGICPWREQVCCVAVTFKMTERVEQQICISFCLKLEHCSGGDIWMIQKAVATGKWWSAVSSPQHTCSLMHHVSCRFFLGNIKSRRWLYPLQPGFGALRLLVFPKTKVIFEREENSDCWWDSGKYIRTADGDWENCVRSRGAYFEGDGGITVLCTMFLISGIFFNKCLYFSLHSWTLSGHI